MKSRAIFILIGLGVFLMLLYPAIKKRAAREDLRSYLDALPVYSMDLSTPQGAVLCLEDAYRRKDIEAAVAYKDFALEAQLMADDLPIFSKLKEESSDPNIYDQAIHSLTNTLELAYRAEITESWPDFEGLTSYFDGQESYKDTDNVVVITEVCLFPDGGYSRQKLVVGKRKNEWKVLYPMD